MEFGLNERLRADFAAMRPTYYDGIAWALDLGANFATYYCNWGADPETGAVCRIAQAILIRPKSSIIDIRNMIVPKVMPDAKFGSMGVFN